MKIPMPAAVMLGVMSMSLSGPAAVAADADAPLRPEILQPMAEHGDAWAQLKLGGLYERGESVPKDNEQAAGWYAKAAAQGNAEARGMLLFVCAISTVGPAQPKACVEMGPLLQTAAAQGDVEAENLLARLYEAGLFGVARDPGKALAWYRKAAEQGDLSAETAMADHYEGGFDAPQDDVQAAFWNRKAAEQGDMLAQYSLARDYETGRGVTADEAQAVAWYLKAAGQGDRDAQRKVGTAYALGKGAPRDDVQAYVWLQIALSSVRVDDEGRDTQALALKSVAARLKPGALAQARRMAAAWKPKLTAP
jgi:TPR repeat protein